MLEKITSVATLATGAGMVAWSLWTAWNIPADDLTEIKGIVLFATGFIGLCVFAMGCINASYAFEKSAHYPECQ